MPDWIENALYLLAGGTMGLFTAALACAAGRADAAAEEERWRRDQEDASQDDNEIEWPLRAS